MKMPKDNRFCYKTIGGTTSGYFDVYQVTTGYIVLAMDDSRIRLTIEQVNTLQLDLYSLDGFDPAAYTTAYKG